MKLTGRIGIVTGGSRGLGRAITLALAREGATVAILSRDKERAEATVKEVLSIGGKASAIKVDVTRVHEIQVAVDRVLSDFGRIDLLINNAGMGSPRPALDLSEEEWDRLIDTNMKGVFFFCQRVAPIMTRQGGGKIINTSSTVAEIGMPGMAAYCASKAGVKLLTKALAIDLAKHGIQVNAVGPGTVRTDINRAALADPSELEWRLARIPLGRLGLPEEIAATVVFLASDEDLLDRHLWSTSNRRGENGVPKGRGVVGSQRR